MLTANWSSSPLPATREVRRGGGGRTLAVAGERGGNFLFHLLIGREVVKHLIPSSPETEESSNGYIVLGTSIMQELGSRSILTD